MLQPCDCVGEEQIGSLRVDRAAHKVWIESDEIALTAREFKLLMAFYDRRGRVMSRERLMEKLRGDALEAFDRSIDVHVARIRAAIEDDPKRPRRIVTVRGAGYVFARVQDEDA